MYLEPIPSIMLLAYLDSFFEASSLTPIATIVPVSNLFKALTKAASL